MAVWEAHPQSFALQAAAVTAGHVGSGPRLVDVPVGDAQQQHETVRIEVDLAIEPGLTLLQDVGAVLLDRVAGLFSE